MKVSRLVIFFWEGKKKIICKAQHCGQGDIKKHNPNIFHNRGTNTLAFFPPPKALCCSLNSTQQPGNIQLARLAKQILLRLRITKLCTKI